MITRYDIAFENNSIILIVNLDFLYEFADFDYKGYVKNLRKEIEEIAQKKHAKIVKIIVSGVLISSLLLTPAKDNNNNSSNIKYITNNTIKECFENINLNSKDENIKVIDSKQESTPKNNSYVNNNTSYKSNTSTIDNNTSYKANTSLKNELTNNDNNITSQNKNFETKEEKDNNVYVTIYRNNGIITSLELEEYLIGVVGSEMPASFNIEALKAQAIVARTYALKRISQNKILTDTTSTQVYKNNDELKIIWKNEFNKYYNKVKNAVISTKGMVMTYNNDYIDAVYHSTSNGFTEDAIHVWGNDIPYLKSVESKSDLNASSFKREKVFTFDELTKILNTNINKDTTFKLERNSSGRVSLVKINDTEIKGTTFRTLLSLRSTDFNIEIIEGTIKITTYGYGHGVGMSQYGANSLGNKGYSYKDILNHYYKNITIKKI